MPNYYAMWIVATGFILLSAIRGQEVKEILPDVLRECYINPVITTRDNLLPFTVNTLISIIRKIEDRSDFTNDMRIVANAISHRFRYDGVQRHPDLGWSDLVIPYSPIGSEFKLFKVIFDKLMPNSPQGIPNNTLSYIERCTLHYMLSLSVEPLDRGDNNEACSKISKYSSSSGWGGGFRFPRDLRRVPNPDVEVFDPEVGPIDFGKHSGSYQQVMNYPQESQCPIESGVIYDKYGTFSPGLVIAGIAAGLQQQNVNLNNLFSPGSTRLRRPGGGRPSSGGFDRPPTFDRNPFGRVPIQGRINFGGPISNRPNSGGGGYPGTGFGGGQYPGTGYGGNSVDNRYAATLSGLIAHVSLLLGPSMGSRSASAGIGMSGGWNDTAIPKYYFIRDYMRNALSDPRLRGGLDGLLLAKEINRWSGSGSLKLSQVLSMYYSQRGLFGTDARACNRRNNINELSQNTDLTENAVKFAVALHDWLPESGTISDEGVTQYATTSTEEAVQYISGSLTETCPSSLRSTTTASTPSPAVDLHVVIDATYNYKDINKIITYLADNIDVSKYASNFSIINGYEGKVIVESVTSSLEVYQNFTYDKYQTGITKGFDFDKLLSALRVRFQDRMRNDQRFNSGGGIGRAVLFVPQASVNFNNKDQLIEKLKQFKVKVPDVKFLYLVTGSKDKFSSFADEPDKDIFIVSLFDNIGQTLDPVIKRIAQTPRRIINPNCGVYWSGGWYNAITVRGYLDRPGIHYYRVHPNYFYKDANARITFKNEDSTQPITVCTSRQPLVVNNSQRCQQLTTRNSKDFWIKSDDCPGSYATQCNPYYFSVSADKTNSPSITISCTESECENPDMIKYTIEHQGLTCYSGASKIIGLPILLFLLLSLSFLS